MKISVLMWTNAFYGRQIELSCSSLGLILDNFSSRNQQFFSHYRELLKIVFTVEEIYSVPNWFLQSSC
jgi:hypothetical protein